MERYNLAARLLHWLMAAGFLLMWVSGYVMTTLVADDSALQELLFSLHISTGVSLLVLLVARLAIRIMVAPPPLPFAMPRWERAGAHLAHGGLYLLPALIILIGWAESDFGGHGVSWFGVSLPKLFPTRESFAGIDLETTLALAHRVLAYSLLALAGLHVAAVIKHRWVDGHDVLRRMTFRSA